MTAANDLGTTPVATLGTEQAFHDEGVDGVDALQVEKRYGEERAKRVRDDANEQFVDISLSEKFRHFGDDPWVDPATVQDGRTMFPNNRCGVLVLGAGLGGLLYAVQMVKAGVRPEDIRIVDTAGGFGGTWYWNRYPGLMCDIESYIYLPLLEETGYIPRHRYAYGDEIREYVNLVAEKWRLAGSGVFQTKAEKLVWDEAAKEWQVRLVQHRNGEDPLTLDIHSQFVVTANGILSWPKLPASLGIMDFQGKTFHTSRWDYAITGGSSKDPSLTNLQDKRVAIIGTGATAVQAIPHLARWAKHLYIVQRTPSAIDRRDQRETDPAWFRKSVATSPGWQRQRLSNFHQHFTIDQSPATNLVDDGWTRAPGMVALAGNASGPRSMEELPAYMSKLHAIDMQRQDRVRARVQQVVKDPDVAEKLQAWYPTWCKRPCFHDEYLSCFNQPNVTLIDTSAKGVERLTHDSIIAGGQTHAVDIIIFATGFRSPFLGSPAEKANMEIIGRNGVSMSENWAANGPSTLHGVLDRNFPNLFLSGPYQTGVSPSWTFGVNEIAQHAAYILFASLQRAKNSGANCGEARPFPAFAIEPSAAAVEAWGMQIMMHATPLAAIAGCTPSYFNLEGALDRLPLEEQMKLARSGFWGHGIESFLTHAEAWRAEGGMQGIEVRV